jgi:peptidyl-prolyl cis-trans isomerase B (cyclophilin B)
LDSSGKYDLTFKIPASEDSGQFQILASAEIGGNKISETKTITQSKEVQSDSEITNDESGGCLIATATYGSELSPQVQQLRELRDNSLLQTSSGSSFMAGFNQIYYSFSPTIADWERENPVFKEAVKIAITPMISSLSILNHVNMETDAEVLGYGISLILLNVGMYFVVPGAVIYSIRKKF